MGKVGQGRGGQGKHETGGQGQWDEVEARSLEERLGAPFPSGTLSLRSS